MGGYKRQLEAEYLEQCPGYGWYSHKVQGLFAILDSYRVSEAVKEDIAKLLGYPIAVPTRLAWAQTSGYPSQALLAVENAQVRGLVRDVCIDVCIDDWVFGWGFEARDMWSGKAIAVARWRAI